MVWLAGGLLRLGDRDPGCRRPDRRRPACQPGRTRRPGAGAVPSGGHDGLAGSVCLPELRRGGFTIAVCSNWGWDLASDIATAGLAASIDVFVTSAQAGYRKPHPRIYHHTLERAGFSAHDAVFIGDSL